MAARVLINNTGSPVPIPDTGVTIAAFDTLIIPPQQYGKFEGSSDVIGPISDFAVSPTVSTLTVNDGTFNLLVTDGTRLIQGGFSRPIADGANPTIKATVHEDFQGVSGQNALQTTAILTDVDPSAVRDWYFEIARGSVSGHQAFNIPGFNPDVKTVEEDVWTNQGTYQFPTVASVLDISSDSALDTAAGTGARTIIVRGLDINYDQIEETVILSGVSIVQTVNEYLRLNFSRVVTAGTVETNGGNITIDHNSSGFTLGQIITGLGRMMNAVFTIPHGKTGFGSSIFLGGSGGQSAIFKFMVRRFGEAFIAENVVEVEATPFSVPLTAPPRRLPEKTDFKIRVSTQTGSSSISASLVVILVDET